MKRFRLFAAGLLALTSLTMAAAPAAFAVDTSSACSALTQLNSNQDCSTHGSGVTSLISTIVNLLSVIVGIAAVIMIIVGGLKYVTSAGDSSKAGSARNTLVYAVIGLVIVALAQFIVHFVINTSTKAAGTGYLPAQVRQEVDA